MRKQSKTEQIYDLQQHVIDIRSEIFEQTDYYEYDTILDYAKDVSYKELEYLVNAEELGYGIHKLCFHKGKYVYSLLHTDEFVERTTIGLDLKSVIWPKHKHICGNLYRMPYYEIVNYFDLNSERRAIYNGIANIKNFDKNSTLDILYEADLPLYIRHGIIELITTLPEWASIICDLRDDNIGWVGNSPRLFDVFLIS